MRKTVVKVMPYINTRPLRARDCRSRSGIRRGEFALRPFAMAPAGGGDRFGAGRLLGIFSAAELCRPGRRNLPDQDSPRARSVPRFGSHRRTRAQPTMGGKLSQISLCNAARGKERGARRSAGRLAPRGRGIRRAADGDGAGIQSLAGKNYCG